MHIYICTYAFSLWLNIQQVSNIWKVDKQIIKNVDFDNRVKRILNAYDIVLKVVHSNNFSSGVNDPIFADFVIHWIYCKALFYGVYSYL